MATTRFILPPYIEDRINYSTEPPSEKSGGGKKKRKWSLAAFCTKEGSEESVSESRGKRNLPHGRPLLINTVAAAQLDENRIIDRVYSAQGKSTLPGEFIGSTDKWVAESKNENALGAWRNAQHFGNFCTSVLNRWSYNNKGAPLDSTVDYDLNYNNAFFSGGRVVFGSGDGQSFHNFARDLTVVSHEWSHGIVDTVCSLQYVGQSGSLNEHCADAFAVSVNQWINRSTPFTDRDMWLIGKNAVVGNGFALRSLLDPGAAYTNHPRLGTDPQPGHMAHFMSGPKDNYGVHYNSGIPNRAFYLFSIKADKPAYDVPINVWYNALQKYVSPNSDFNSFASATLRSAAALYPSDQNINGALKASWEEVGLSPR